MIKYEKKWSLRSRVFGMMFFLLAVVFILIFLSFNFFMNNYINFNVTSQLEVFTNHHREYNDAVWPDLSKQPDNKVGVRAEAFVIDRAYTILHIYDEAQAQSAEIIVRYLEEQSVELEGISNFHIRTEDKVYYLSTVPDEKHENAYLVFYADVTTISEFSETINTILVIVVVIAAVLSFGLAAIIAYSVTKPIRLLSDFAGKIGTGDFRSNAYCFRDKELDALAGEMNKSAAQLANYDSEQKTFFQNVSHELRTPLMAIKVNAEGIQYGLMEKEKSSGIIISEVDRLSELVEDLLYISRIDSITQHIEMQENDLRETLSLCAENQKSIADKNHIAFVYDFAGKPVLLSYNEKHMYRAFYNLISNALQYAKSKVILSCGVENDKAIISVADDGPGISENDLPHIFERFYKGANGKHGIGLSIVKSVIDLHGGSVRATCTDMTYFIVELPIR
jgi:two-component system sensor histidine kinase CssS